MRGPARCPFFFFCLLLSYVMVQINYFSTCRVFFILVWECTISSIHDRIYTLFLFKLLSLTSIHFLLNEWLEVDGFPQNSDGVHHERIRCHHLWNICQHHKKIDLKVSLIVNCSMFWDCNLDCTQRDHCQPMFWVKQQKIQNLLNEKIL